MKPLCADLVNGGDAPLNSEVSLSKSCLGFITALSSSVVHHNPLNNLLGGLESTHTSVVEGTLSTS